MFGAVLAIGLSPAVSQAEIDATSDAHRAVQAAAQARKAERAAADAARAAQALDPVTEPTFGEWLDATGAWRNRMVVWMGGAYSGLVWSNAEASARGHAPIFCPPSRATMTGQKVMTLVTAHTRGGAQIPRNRPLGAVVLSAMKAAFPCPATP
jgi:hypothetical protein